MQSHTWNSFTKDQKEDHISKFCNYQSTTDDFFEKPSISRRKPGYQARCRHRTGPDLVVERPTIVPFYEATLIETSTQSSSLSFEIDMK